VAAQHILNTAHTVGCTVELASALTAATILADATVTPTVSEMTYDVSSETDVKPYSVQPIWSESRIQIQVRETEGQIRMTS